MKCRGKVFLVTGAGSGMGQELALELLRRGARVAGVDLRQEGLDETAGRAEAGERFSTHLADITDRARVEELPDEVVAAHGTVDAIVNMAGIIQPFVKLADLDYDVMERVVNVNFWGTVHVLKTFLPLLLERPAAHVINVSSMGGFLPVPGQAIYGATKAAVKLMTEGLYAELLDTPVDVSVVLPGAVATHISENSGVEAPGGDMDPDDAPIKPLPAADAARIIADGIERNKLHILVGRDSKMMYAASRIAPKGATHLIQRQMKSLLGD